jgi:hypothetical protein
LTEVLKLRAVIQGILNSVAVPIKVADVPQPVVVQIILAGIGDTSAVVLTIAHAITIHIVVTRVSKAV